MIINYQSAYKYLILFSHLMFDYLTMCERKFGIEKEYIREKKKSKVIALL